MTRDEMDFLENEVEVLKQLNHPNIVSLHDQYWEGDYWYIVLDLMQKGSVSNYPDLTLLQIFDALVTQSGDQAKNYFTEAQTKLVIRSLAGAVAHCHQKGIVLRNIDLENILIFDRQDLLSIKLSNVGYSKLETGYDSLRHFKTNIAYTAPETFDDH